MIPYLGLPIVLLGIIATFDGQKHEKVENIGREAAIIRIVRILTKFKSGDKDSPGCPSRFFFTSYSDRCGHRCLIAQTATLSTLDVKVICQSYSMVDFDGYRKEQLSCHCRCFYGCFGLLCVELDV